MKQNIFAKFLFITTSILLASFLLLGTVLLAIISGYWTSDKKSLLFENASNTAGLTAGLVERNGYAVDTVMNSMISILSQSIDADIFVVDSNGKVLLCSEENCVHQKYTIPQNIMTATQKGRYDEVGTFLGIYKTKQFIVGVPIRLSDGSAIGAVFAASPAIKLDAFRRDVIMMFLWASLLAAVLSFMVLFVTNYRMVRPLRAMANAAKAFGEGDFSKRVPVTGDDEIGQLAAEFNNMAVSLASLEDMRRSFVANVSHELRTPMTTISGFVDGILDGTIEKDKEKQYLKVVSDEVKRLSRLIQSMLDLTRIDNGDMKMNPIFFDLSSLVLQTLLSFEKRIDQKHLELRGLETLTKIEVEADSDLIHQVIYNLIDNAVKFANEDGYIEILVEQNDTAAFFSVENSGLGIASDELPQVFERFYKTDKSRSFDRKGMGIGLFIVKSVINLHGGEISVSSVENEYCRFRFWIPKSQNRPQPKEIKEKGRNKEKDKEKDGQKNP